MCLLIGLPLPIPHTPPVLSPIIPRLVRYDCVWQVLPGEQAAHDRPGQLGNAGGLTGLTDSLGTG